MLAENGPLPILCDLPPMLAQAKESNQRLKCLGVTIGATGVMWGCNHCDWTGGQSYDGKDNQLRTRAVVRTRQISVETPARFEIYTGRWEGDRIVPDPTGDVISFPYMERGVRAPGDPDQLLRLIATSRSDDRDHPFRAIATGCGRV
jgi:hypothetical protein